ncbi:MAG TPA: hypothetical protein VGS41_18485 [Chthonomonadales bacterium]|nr:hypothetical protein [Chthonomonadales bacterium]
MARVGNGLVELDICPVTGRWLMLTDLERSVNVLRSGEQPSPILLTVNGREQTRYGYGQMFTLIDTETIGLHWRCAALETSCDGKSSVAAVTRDEDGWRVQLRYLLR